MPRPESVISLDPIDRKRKLGIIGRLLITRWYGGKPVKKEEPYGHYMFTGSQGSGKSAGVLWYTERLIKKYRRRKIRVTIPVEFDPNTNEILKTVVKKFDKPPTIKLYSNIGVGNVIDKTKIFDKISSFDPYANEVRIVLIDEIHTYFPKGTANKQTQAIRDDLINIFSQLRKRNTYILTTAQVYGRLDKALREQCLFMVACSVTRGGKLINEFIPGDDIICDELGRWAGNPKYIYKHGLSTLVYDTKRIIRE